MCAQKGYDEYGESTSLPRRGRSSGALSDEPALPPLRSCVFGGNDGHRSGSYLLASALSFSDLTLEHKVNLLCAQIPDLYAFAAATFYARTGGGDAGDTATALRSAVDSALASLLAAKLIAAADEDNTAAVTEPCEPAAGDAGDSGAVDDAPRDVTGAVSGKYIALPLGMAAFRANLSPAAAGTVHDRLLNAQRALCLLDELHVCVCCTPPQPEAAVNWRTYAHVFSKLSESATHVAQLVGVDAALIHRRAFRTGAPLYRVPSIVGLSVCFSFVRCVSVVLVSCSSLICRVVVQAADKQKEASCTLY